MFWVSCLKLLRENILYFFIMPWWLRRGKAHLKQQISDRVDVAAESLPYNSALIGYLIEQKTMGRRIVLATATNRKYANAVARHLALFDEVIASDEYNNFKGTAKRDRLLAQYGRNGFDYAGNDRVDLEIWPYSRGAILVNASSNVRQEAERAGNVIKIL